MSLDQWVALEWATIFLLLAVLIMTGVPGERRARRARWEADHPGVRWEDWKHER